MPCIHQSLLASSFGAFVDIGVHQDGLVHISALANTFVKDPHSVVKAGQVVKVKVLEVDEKRKRIALTMRLSDEAPKAGMPKLPQKNFDRSTPRNNERGQSNANRGSSPPINNAMAAAFGKLKK